MRRLTLILSDLYLQAESVNENLPRTHVLPSLDWLLRFAESQTIGDWRSWLRGESAAHLGAMPLPVIAGEPDAAMSRMDNVWLATPVALEARLDHVRLLDRGLLRLTTQDSADWCREFNQVFGPRYQLRHCGERAFQLIGVEPAGVATVDPARLLGSDIGPSLPGSQAVELRRLWTEIEMWLHGSPLNAAREQRRLPRVSALWIWGQGSPETVAAAGKSTDVAWYGGDPLMRGLSLRAAIPGRAASWNDVAAVEQVFAEFAPLTGAPEESLPALEEHWFAPARAAVEQRRIEQVQVVANDRVFTVRPGMHWKFWRRQRRWLESLA